MALEVMRKRASDNDYLHKDFHGALSCGIEYLYSHYGAQAVRDYLRDFTLAYYAPLREDLKQRGLIALKEHFAETYRIEGGEIAMQLAADELVLRVAACPALLHLRQKGYPVARLFSETTRTVNTALCEGTPYAVELLEYDEQTGRSAQRFCRRRA